MKVNRSAAATLLAAAVAIVVIGACGRVSGDDATPAPTGTQQAPTPVTPSTSPAVVATLPTGTPPTSAAPPLLATPQAAAEHLYDAWRANDRPTAQLAASDAAVDTLFAEIWTPDTYFFGGCTQPTAPSDCQYNWAHGAVVMHIDGDSATGFRVVSVSFSSAG